MKLIITNRAACRIKNLSEKGIFIFGSLIIILCMFLLYSNITIHIGCITWETMRDGIVTCFSSGVAYIIYSFYYDLVVL